MLRYSRYFEYQHLFALLCANKLQRTQNRVAKVVCHRNCSNSNENLSRMHWLPLNSHIKYKTASLTHKLIKTNSPGYLASLLKPYVPVRPLRSADSNMLEVPRCRTVAGSFAFAYHAPSIWNSIPLSVREPVSVPFHSALKLTSFSQSLLPGSCFPHAPSIQPLG